MKRPRARRRPPVFMFPRRQPTTPERIASRLHKMDSRLFDWVAHRRDGGPEVVLPVISATANHSILWVGIAGILAGFGGRRGKRAAGRGLGSIALTSLTVSQGIKRVARRPRPSLRHVPKARQLKAAPLTTSFPSGHAASAAAFSTSVVMEWPAAGAVVLPLAAAVGYSRVYVGVHYPGDVAVGAATGTAVALLTRLQFPAVPVRRLEVPVTEPHHVEVDPDGDGLRVMINPGSGSPLAPDHSGPIEIGLPDAEIREPREGEKPPEAMKRIAEGARALAASGGDGTIALAATAACDASVPLLVIPGGTLNHLARDLRIDSVGDSIDVYKNGEAIDIDLGTVGDTGFINTATFGSYPDMIKLRETLQKRIGRWPAHVVSVLWTVTRAEPLQVEMDGERRTIWMAFVGNCAHEPAGFAPGWRPQLDDGKLDLRLLHGEQPLARLRLILSILAGRLTRSAAYERHLVERIEVDAGQDSLPITLDGDYTECPGKFVIGKRKRCLTVFAPHA
ncbi:MAG: bifunctional phosphatase PAP2/diacylglycerol kinase family protein [Solirubrobacterales bacterium]